MNNSQDPLEYNSAESNPSSAETIWNSSMSPMSLASPAVQVYSDQNPYFPASQAADVNVWQPYSATAAPGPNGATITPANKVAIPRLAASSAFRGRRRSARACESCRQRKIKCDGSRPTCGQCVYHNNQCVYEDVKRVRDQKKLDLLTQRVGRYESLLRRLEGEVEPPTARKIRKELKIKDGQSSKLKPTDDDSGSDSSVGSLYAVDEVDEDLNRNESTRAAGFFGKNSEVSWLQKLEDGAESQSSHGPAEMATPSSSSSLAVTGGTMPGYAPEKLLKDISIGAVNYHLDDLDIPLIEDTDPFTIPRREAADEYVNAYMTYVHPFFSAIRRAAFIAQYQKFFDRSAQPPRKWLAILNMIFAIGCRHCRLINYHNQMRYDDDLLFLTRARHLGLHENVLFGHADLQQIQLELLVAVYLLCLGQVNRASKFSSMALHSAISLGINLRLTDGRVEDVSKEARNRLWWSIYAMEHLLTSMHGRASCVGESLCSIHLPMPFEEENFDRPEMSCLLQDHAWRETRLCPTILEATSSKIRDTTEWKIDCPPSPSLLFYHLVDLDLISQAVLNKVYSIEGIREGTSQTEYRLQKYGVRLDRWLSKLPNEYRFTVAKEGQWQLDHAQLDDSSLPLARERVCLAMSYYSARITLYRPCLTHTNSPINPSTQEQSPHAKYRIEMATNCLQAACSLISILPGKTDVGWLIRLTPYWSILHFLMQATTALLLALRRSSFSAPPSNESNSAPAPDQTHGQPYSKVSYPPLLDKDIHTVVALTKKALSWINAMATIDPASRRAFLLCDDVLKRIAPALQIDLQDWPSADSLAGDAP